MLHLCLRYARAWSRGSFPRSGPLTLLFAVFRPYTLSPLVVLLALVPWRFQRVVRALLLIVAVVAIGRRVLRLPVATNGGVRFTVMSWNILFENPRFDALLVFLATAPAPVIAIQELTAAHIQQIQDDAVLARLYPHQILWASGFGAGMGLFSQYPIVEQGKLDKPPTLWARLQIDAAHQAVVVSAHPTFFPPRTSIEPPKSPPSFLRRVTHLLDRRFLRYNTEHRDDGIQRVRALVDELLQAQTPVVVVGDFNVTEREPAYHDLAAGLTDVHRTVGIGMGHTWRPEWLARSPLAILRIDHMFSGPGIRPLSMRVDRTPRGSDHSPVIAAFEFDS